MADDPNVPAQPESAGPTNKKKAAPVNLAMIEAEKRGLDLTVPKPEPKAPKRPVAEPPTPHTVPPTPEPVVAAAPAAETDSEPAEPVAENESQRPPDAEAPPENRSENRREQRGDRRGGGQRGDNRGENRGEPRAEAADETPLPTDPDTIRAELATLADQSTKGRLSPRDEDRATAHLRACLSAGDSAPALAAMPKLPWILGVRAIEQAWPALAPEARTTLLASLSELPGEYAVRLRLSVARSLLRLDPPVGIELAGAVCQTMWDAEKGALSAEHSKLIGNVFIGRGKPWVLQLPLEKLGPAEADAVASCVVFSAFNVNNPPITQLSILRYAGDRLAGLHPNLLGLVAKNIGRWGGRWQGALRKEIPNLPEPLSAALKPAEQPRKPEPAARREPPPEKAPAEEELPLPPELEEKLKLAAESGDSEAVAAVNLEVNAWRAAQRSAAPPPREEEPAAEDSEDQRGGRRGRRGRERERDRERDRNEKKERPAYISREQEAKAAPSFNLGQSLKQIENYVQQLRNELVNTQTRLRKTETSRKSSPDRVMLSVEESNLSPEELKRLVVQLEQRNSDLSTRIEELLADSEARALATASDNDITGQYRTLLKIKLQEDYNDYLALEKNSPEFVVQQHYRALIRHVFAILRDEGIGLKGDLPPPPPPPMPPVPPPPVIEGEEDEEPSPLDALDAEVDPAAGQEAADAELPPDEDAGDEEIGDEVPSDELAGDGESAEGELSDEEADERPSDDDAPDDPETITHPEVESPTESEQERDPHQR